MSLNPIEKAASGALASAIANTLVYPLDLSKTLIQTQVKTKRSGGSSKSMLMDESNSRASNSTDKSTASIKSTPIALSGSDDSVFHQEATEEGDLKYRNTIDVLKQIYKKKGILGWYHGILSSIFGTAAQNFSYFYWYTIVKRVYANINKHIPNHKPSTIMELLLGALAAAISQMFTMPIGVITTQQQTDKEHKNLYQLAKDVYTHDGITGFWRGLRVSMVLCVNPSITYGSYERLRQILYADKQYLGPLESFSLGVIAKSLATIATQPLIVSKAMLQKKTDTQEDSDDIKFDSFTHALEHLWQTEKFKGLYKGIAPQLVKGVFVQGLLFMFKDQIDLVFLMLLKAIKKK